MTRLTGKTIIVSGAAGGIGKKASETFLDAGANVVAFDLEEPSIKGATNLVGDVTSGEDWSRICQNAVDAFGAVDGLVNNAGIEGVVSPIADYPEEMFRRVLEVNVTGSFLGLKHVAAVMTNGGSIINVSSVAGLGGAGSLGAYAASKHAVIGLTKSAALDMAASGIRVNAVCPAPIQTRMIEALEDGIMVQGVDRETARSLIQSTIPMGRYGKPEEVASLMVFLLSDESAFLSGAAIPIDGAMKAR